MAGAGIDRGPAPAGVLSIDPASKCGWAMWTGGRLFRLGTWKLSSGKPLELRFRQVAKHVARAVGELQHASGGRVVVAFEEAPFNTTGIDSTMSAYGLRALLMVTCAEQRVRYLRINVSTAKKSATGYGDAHKAEIIAAISKRFSIPKLSDDEADAVAVGIVAHERLGLTLTTPAIEPLPRLPRPPKKKRKAKR